MAPLTYYYQNSEREVFSQSNGTESELVNRTSYYPVYKDLEHTQKVGSLLVTYQYIKEKDCE